MNPSRRELLSAIQWQQWSSNSKWSPAGCCDWSCLCAKATCHFSSSTFGSWSQNMQKQWKNLYNCTFLGIVKFSGDFEKTCAWTLFLLIIGAFRGPWHVCRIVGNWCITYWFHVVVTQYHQNHQNFCSSSGRLFVKFEASLSTAASFMPTNFLSTRSTFPSFFLHFHNAPLSGDRLLLLTLKPITFSQVQLCTGERFPETDWRLETNAGGLYVRFGASEFNSKFCNRRSCS